MKPSACACGGFNAHMHFRSALRLLVEALPDLRPKSECREIARGLNGTFETRVLLGREDTSRDTNSLLATFITIGRVYHCWPHLSPFAMFMRARRARGAQLGLLGRRIWEEIENRLISLNSDGKGPITRANRRKWQGQPT
eukprot:3672419-Pleurochrysis_carterae.AAC.2